MFLFSAQVLVYAFVGPTLGGAPVTAGIAYPWGFSAFTLAAVLAVAHPRHGSGARTGR
jgi:hypothetical protein